MTQTSVRPRKAAATARRHERQRCVRAPAGVTPRPFEESYREQIKWSKWTWGSHCVDCYPSNCPFRVYVGKDGEVWREEQSGTYGTVETGRAGLQPRRLPEGRLLAPAC